MKQNKKTFIAMLSTSTFLGAVGQIFFKLGVTNGALPLIIAFLFIGLFAYFVSSLIYIYVLTRTQLSWAYGFGGLAYVFASLIAFLFLGEQVPILRWAGIAAIAIGTALIGLS